jgi:hypothetical protein
MIEQQFGQGWRDYTNDDLYAEVTEATTLAELILPILYSPLLMTLTMSMPLSLRHVSVEGGRTSAVW